MPRPTVLSEVRKRNPITEEEQAGTAALVRLLLVCVDGV
jgi:hypothetical protein